MSHADRHRQPGPTASPYHDAVVRGAARPARPGGDVPGRARPGRSPALGAILVGGRRACTRGTLSSNGMSNSFYAAAVKSGTESWKGVPLRVDRPGIVHHGGQAAPLRSGSWSCRGASSGSARGSMLLPEAPGRPSARCTCCTERCGSGRGELAAVLAAPRPWPSPPVATLMFRIINDPDAFPHVPAGGVGRPPCGAALESGRTRWLVLCGSLIGLALPSPRCSRPSSSCPPFGLVYLICADSPPQAPGRPAPLGGPRPRGVVRAGGGPLVQLWPAGGSRPYVGGEHRQTPS